MICFPNCKINIGLYITEKRPDSFHNIETIFYPVPLHDALEVIESNKNEFTLSGIDIPGNREANLCLRAYDILLRKFKLPPVKIHLHKAIPTGAGLGGGSADAAFMIKLLNDVFSLNMNITQMQEIAANLGSDCSFFIENIPLYATNKGDVFENIKLDLSKYHIVLAKPDLHISTSEAFSLIAPKKAAFQLNKIESKKMKEWKKHIVNDFEEVVFRKFPEIKAIKEKMYESGAVYASMSGSGSTVYGIFKKEINIKGLFDNCFAWQGKLN
ncbi:MAG: 4-(cytidine 5'-diphospho)-2-C-methyl-D-erythritol kinase [Bacteroidales bacterium]|jgi:4-diphosphocytidyl-2-C-methyl-D-erythritol kinase